jgi:hypothetical protein
MDTRRVMSTAVSVIVSAALLVPMGSCVASSPAVRSVAYQRCKDVVIRNEDGSVYTQTKGLFQKNAGCAPARRLAHRYLANDGVRPATLLGYTCTGGVDGVSCKRGNRRITWGYYID